MRSLVLAVITALLVTPAPASATLAYERSSGQAVGETHAIISARDDGSQGQLIGHGFAPIVSPSGKRIAFFASPGHSTNLYVTGSHGAPRRLILRGVWATNLGDLGQPLAWSRDGRWMVVGDAHSTDAYVVDRRTDTSRRVPLEGFAGASFASSGTQFVASDAGASRSGSLFVVDARWPRKRQHLDGGTFPVWGPDGIAFARHNRILFRKGIGKHRQVVLATNGQRAIPVDWSAHGDRLLVAREQSPGEFNAVVVTFQTRKVTQLPLTFTSVDAISRDGQRVLGEREGNVVVAGVGGSTRVLARSATEASWGR